MNGSIGLWRMGLGLWLAALLLMPGLGRAKEDSFHGMPREELVKELDLPPAKARKFLAVGDKYEQTRENIIEGIKRDERELEKALSAPQPDEKRIKDLVAAVTAGHDQLFESFKGQRHEEMALLTPRQQGKFLIALKRWHQEMREQLEKQEKTD
jgi:Spy/CpxP family protein refolding chaperone